MNIQNLIFKIKAEDNATRCNQRIEAANIDEAIKLFLGSFPSYKIEYITSVRLLGTVIRKGY